MNKSKKHRGARGAMREYAPKFLTGRMEGFTKDMQICLTGIPSKTREGETHAYFPALMSCCGTLEYVSALSAGQIQASKNDINRYAKRFLPANYSVAIVHVLEGVFRNPVAHRGISSGVWKDEHKEFKGRRLTWKVSEEDVNPAVQIVEENGVLCIDSPWDCSYTHRVHVYLGRLWKDIRDSVIGPRGYLDQLGSDDELLEKFESAMHELYPD